ncbi:palmitoyltransferase ZDHHC20-like [Ochotona princeps]|uniref:palmitoyltransferase ZDHHC20-like n=1 Tax=Ochotona princeps TaxID=9978 RepID=UPI002714A9A0|nr:palmitoyltransferase ZDHHC20-like [Ochotona princeps]
MIYMSHSDFPPRKNMCTLIKCVSYKAVSKKRCYCRGSSRLSSDQYTLSLRPHSCTAISSSGSRTSNSNTGLPTASTANAHGERKSHSGGGGTPSAAAAAGPYGSSVAGYRRSLLAPPPGHPQPGGATGGGGTSSSSRRAGGRCFLLAVLFLIAFLYFGYVFGLLLPMLLPFPTPAGVLLFLVFHCCFLLLLCSFFKAVFTDPGRVPANWGFYMGDENKRRRYCKVCDVWKPDRTHHCSACGRCVLNMDHHCPWINNCVGFYNRKYFIQLLVYALISLFMVFCHGFYFIFMESLRTGTQLHYGRAPRQFSTGTSTTTTTGEVDFQQHAPWSVLRYVYVCLVLFVSMILIFALIPFSRFHMNLVLRNSTTIENMDVVNRDRNRYDLGVSRNVEQVFGANPCCWLIPLQSAATRPVGDGVRWSMHYMVANDDQYYEYIDALTLIVSLAFFRIVTYQVFNSSILNSCTKPTGIVLPPGLRHGRRERGLYKSRRRISPVPKALNTPNVAMLMGSPRKRL